MKDRAYEIATNLQYLRCQRALASIGYKFFEKKTVSGISVNGQLAGELHRPVIKKFKRRNAMRDLKTIFGQGI